MTKQPVIPNITIDSRGGDIYDPADFATGTPAQAAPELPPIVDRDELIALLQDLASVNLSREACERQARRMADDLIARGLTLAAQPPAAPVDLTNHHNALKCPYCNPKGLQFAEPLERLSAATAIEQWEREWPDRPCGWEDSEARLRLMEIIRAVPQRSGDIPGGDLDASGWTGAEQHNPHGRRR